MARDHGAYDEHGMEAVHMRRFVRMRMTLAEIEVDLHKLSPEWRDQFENLKQHFVPEMPTPVWLQLEGLVGDIARVLLEARFRVR